MDKDGTETRLYHYLTVSYKSLIISASVVLLRRCFSRANAIIIATQDHHVRTINIVSGYRGTLASLIYTALHMMIQMLIAILMIHLSHPFNSSSRKNTTLHRHPGSTNKTIDATNRCSVCKDVVIRNGYAPEVSGNTSRATKNNKHSWVKNSRDRNLCIS